MVYKSILAPISEAITQLLGTNHFAIFLIMRYFLGFCLFAISEFVAHFSRAEVPTPSCFRCICQASSNCDLRNLKCSTNSDYSAYCGPYQLSRSYWEEGNAIGYDFETCANMKACAERVIINYMKKYARDCNNDGYIDCDDYAAIHNMGPERCDDPSIWKSEYWRVYRSKCPVLESPPIIDEPWRNEGAYDQPADLPADSPAEIDPLPVDPPLVPEFRSAVPDETEEPEESRSVYRQGRRRTQPRTAVTTYRYRDQPRNVASSFTNTNTNTRRFTSTERRLTYRPLHATHRPIYQPVTSTLSFETSSLSPVSRTPVSRTSSNPRRRRPTNRNARRRTSLAPRTSVTTPSTVAITYRTTSSSPITPTTRASSNRVNTARNSRDRRRGGRRNGRTKPTPSPPTSTPLAITDLSREIASNSADGFENDNVESQPSVPANLASDRTSTFIPEPNDLDDPVIDSILPHFLGSNQSISISDGCMRCLCESADTCENKGSCKNSNGPCGPFQVTFDQWSSVGKPKNDFVKCASSYQCSSNVMRKLLIKNAVDCNGDVVINCVDFAIAFRSGEAKCSNAAESLFKSNYWYNFETCYGFDRR